MKLNTQDQQEKGMSKPSFQSIEFVHALNPIPYDEAMSWMMDRVQAIQQGAVSECVWFLEHPALYTIGTSGSRNDILVDNQTIHIEKTTRGGKVTYHGPGQRIIYLMLKLDRWKNDIRKYVCFLQDIVIETLGSFGIKATCHPEQIGIWVEQDSVLHKIGSIGIRVSRGVTSHGMAININPHLKAFDAIVPCGLKNVQMTSVQQMDANISLQHFDDVLLLQIKKHLQKDELAEDL